MAPSVVFLEPDNLLTPKERNKVSPDVVGQLGAMLSAALVAVSKS